MFLLDNSIDIDIFPLQERNVVQCGDTDTGSACVSLNLRLFVGRVPGLNVVTAQLQVMLNARSR